MIRKQRMLALVLVLSVLCTEPGLVRARPAKAAEADKAAESGLETSSDEIGDVLAGRMDDGVEEAGSQLENSEEEAGDALKDSEEEAANGPVGSGEEIGNVPTGSGEEIGNVPTGSEEETGSRMESSEEAVQEDAGNSFCVDTGDGADRQKLQDGPGAAEGQAEEITFGRSVQAADSVAEVKMDDNITYVNVGEIPDVFGQQDKDVAIRLLSDVSVVDEIFINSDITYELDLNGKEFSKTGDRYLFNIHKGILSVCDSGTNGRIINYSDIPIVVTGGKLRFTGGTLLYQNTGIAIQNGSAEITGHACIKCDFKGADDTKSRNGIYLYENSRLVLSGQAQVYGKRGGIGIGLLGGKTGSYELVVSGQPRIVGDMYGLYTVNFDGSFSAAISGGTFSGAETALFLQHNNGNDIALRDLLMNYGTDLTPKYAFFDAGGPIPAAGNVVPDTVTVRECTHIYSDRIHIDGTSKHQVECAACGDKSQEACSYEWTQVGNDYNGLCSCGSRLDVVMQPEPDCVYNGREHQVEVSVMLDGKLLEADNYAVQYENNRDAGTAAARVYGQGGLQFSCSAEFDIAPARLTVTKVEAAEREYDGTDVVAICEVGFAGVIGNDDVAAVADGLTGTISAAGAGSYDTLTLSGSMTLKGEDSGNYVLQEPGQVVAAYAVIHKAKAAAANAVLKVETGREYTCQFDLEQLCPALPPGQEFGSTPARYVLGDVMLSENYYAGGAKIEGTYLMLPLHAIENEAGGNIGTVRVTVQTDNFEDMDAQIEVQADAGSNSGNDSENNSTDSSTDSSTESSKGNSGVPNIYLEPAMPFLKDSVSQRGWPIIQLAIERAEKGAVIAVDMNGTAIVPSSLFDMLRKRDAIATLDMGWGLTWSIDGKGGTDGSIGEIDFSVKPVSGEVPAKAADAVAEGLAYTELELSQKGVKETFDLETTLVMQTPKIHWTGESAGSSSAEGYAGMHANLFSYNKKEEELEFATSGEIDKDGNVKLSFSEKTEEDGNVRIRFIQGSLFMVVLSEKPMGGTTDQPGKTDNGEIQDIVPEPDDTERKSVKSVKLSKTKYIYNGRVKRPSVSAEDTEGKRIDEKYYTVTYKKNKKPGTAVAYITFKGDYKSKGTVKRCFQIQLASTSIEKAVAAHGAVTVSWKAVLKGDGYQIQYSTDKKFQKKNTHSKLIHKPSVVRKTVRQWKPLKNGYVRIRTYKTVKAGEKKKTVYSVWSDPVRVKKS